MIDWEKVARDLEAENERLKADAERWRIGVGLNWIDMKTALRIDAARGE